MSHALVKSNRIVAKSGCLEQLKGMVIPAHSTGLRYCRDEYSRNRGSIPGYQVYMCVYAVASHRPLRSPVVAYVDPCWPDLPGLTSTTTAGRPDKPESRRL
ncbi:uncharacterized protein FTOL_13815 [Fusarium torulosum]|uniref:Uncharacterized protein n=1 Tax=Fusarium torulosum TaxID=33205 RepID=A0AAE8SQ93_9HYPO|nr:uncharacterized protein FTOL_13815 [Fusarium torulosum]